MVTNVNDVAVRYTNYLLGPNTTHANFAFSAHIFLIAFSVRLLESKSVIALSRLNSIGDKKFASNVSKFLGVPINMESKNWTRLTNNTYDSQMRGDESLSFGLSKYKRMLFYCCVTKYQSMVV